MGIKEYGITISIDTELKELKKLLQLALNQTEQLEETLQKISEFKNPSVLQDTV